MVVTQENGPGDLLFAMAAAEAQAVNDLEQEELARKRIDLNFDLDLLHPHGYSLVNLFQRAMKQKYVQQKTGPSTSKQMKTKYHPPFYIIDCNVYLQERKARRPRTDFTKFQQLIESFGGEYTAVPNWKLSSTIPVLFESADQNLNNQVARAWKTREKDEFKHFPRDVFSESYFTNSIKDGRLDNLNKYRVGETSFYPYDANLLIEGVAKWDKLKLLTAPASTNPLPTVNAKNPTQKNTANPSNVNVASKSVTQRSNAKSSNVNRASTEDSESDSEIII